MQKFKARWLALVTALVLLCTFALAACNITKPQSDDLGELRGVFIVTSDLKTTYEVGDTFDYSAVKLRAVYEGGEEQLTAADADKGVTHTDIDMTTAGTQTLTVTYKEQKASIGITIHEAEVAVLKGLQFSGGKTAYQVGDEIDYSDFELKAIYSVGDDVTLHGDSEGVTATPASVSTEEEGETAVTFSYTDGGVTKSVTVTITVTAAPAPVTLISIEVQSNAADRTVEFGGTVDYSKFTIVCHYSDGTTNTEPLNGTSAGVSHNPEIDTSVPGNYDLTFTYGGKAATVPFTVLAKTNVITLHRFALPQSYSNVAATTDDAQGTASTDRDTFMKGFETYKVGDDNAFEFQPDASALVSTTEAISITVRTTFTLEKKGSDGNFAPVAESEVQNYVKTDSTHLNYYWFQEDAIGEVFKLTIKPDEALYTFGSTIIDENQKKIVAIIEVVDGYNVYNQIGLSVFDNLNVKHWRDVKAEAGTLRWDSKPLTDYNIIKTGDAKFAPVKNVVLHGDITIDPDQLPDSYFWQTTDEGYNTVNNILTANGELPDSVKNHLAGSLKDGLNKDQYYKFDDATSSEELNEDAKTSVNMQKGVYVSTGTGIEGNFHEITYHTSGTKHSLYTVYDGKTSTGSAFPLSHWSLFKYGKATTAGVEIVNEGKPHISDLRILGQSPREAATDGLPAHLMAINTCTNEVNLENAIVSRLFVVVLGDQVPSVSAGVNVSDSKFFDIYSNMFYLWRAKIDVKNSIMEDAGGPVFILCDGNRVASDESAPGQIIVDKASRLKSDASGSESWYVLNNATAIFTSLKTTVRGYINTSTLRDPMHKGEGDVELYNVIAIVVPEPSSLSTVGSDTSNTYYPKGTIKRGTEGAYTDDYAVDWKFAAGGILQWAGKKPDDIYTSQAPIFISGTEKAAYVGLSLAQYLYANEENVAASTATSIDFAGKGTDWMFVTLRAVAGAPRFGILFGDVTEYVAS